MNRAKEGQAQMASTSKGTEQSNVHPFPLPYRKPRMLSGLHSYGSNENEACKIPAKEAQEPNTCIPKPLLQRAVTCSQKHTQIISKPFTSRQCKPEWGVKGQVGAWKVAFRFVIKLEWQMCLKSLKSDNYYALHRPRKCKNRKERNYLRTIKQGNRD